MRTIIQLLLSCTVVMVSALLVYEMLDSTDIPTFIVEKDYKEQFAATCAVVSSADTTFDYGGTGILLSNGKILTAKHVVDENDNGIIDDNETSIMLKFYYPKEFTCRGSVIFAPKERLRVSKGFDFVIIKPERKMKSNIRLTSIDDYISTGAGAKVYTIGRMNGDEPHIVFGNQSTDLNDSSFYTRTDLDVWHGNSGGGVFRESDGALLGVMVIKHDANSFPPYRLWSGYLGSLAIRFYLNDKEEEYLIYAVEETKAYKLQTFVLIPLIFINCFLGVYFGTSVLCERVRDMQGADADV